MTRIFTIVLALLFAMPLTACAGLTTVPTAPSAITNLTKADEQAIVTAEGAYKLWRQSVEIGVNAGFIKGERAGRIAALDNQLYLALKAAESAYEGSNADNLAVALVNFNAALANARAALAGSQ